MTPQELRAIATKWKADIELYERLTADWRQRGSKVVQRYMDERLYGMNGIASDVYAEAKFNILWSNVQTMMPAVYSRTPKPEVCRRYQDRDPVGRVASTILERCLSFESEQYNDFDAALRMALQDRLLPARGVAWIRYEPTFRQREITLSEDDLDGGTYDQEGNAVEAEPQTEEYTEHECAPVDYVNWKDFGHSYARTWEEVGAIWRRVFMTKGELEERFGDVAEQFGYKIDEIPLDQTPDEVRKAGGPDNDEGKERKAAVYEVWDKALKRVCWINTTLEVPLDVRDDPLKLDGFFPCPKPLYGTLSNNSLIPVPDYCLYQDQARELDEVTNRIGMLQKAVKVVGVYDASQIGVKRMLNEGVNNTLIPIDTWAAFGEKGGLKGVIDWLPLDVVIKALQELYVARDQIKQVIYEITGLSDIIRGASNANETATAQQIKSNYAGLRIRMLQNDVARFARELIRMRAEIMCEFYSDETLVGMSSAIQIPEVQKNPQILMQALQLLRDDVVRDFRIDIETDSMVEIDEQQDKQSATELITAIGAILKDGLPAVQAVPELGVPIGETLMMVMRKFRAGKGVEAAWDDALTKLQEKAQQPRPPAPPDPRLQVAQIQAQTDMQVEPMRAQAEVAKAQAGVQKANMDLQKTAIQAATPQIPQGTTLQ